MSPYSGTALCMRQRYSCDASSGEGFLNDVTWQPCGFTPLITWRIVPSFPAASRPCRTISRACFLSAYIRYCNSSSRVAHFSRLALVLWSFSHPSVSAGSHFESLTCFLPGVTMSSLLKFVAIGSPLANFGVLVQSLSLENTLTNSGARLAQYLLPVSSVFGTPGCNIFLTQHSQFRSMISFSSGAPLMATVLLETSTTTRTSSIKSPIPKRQYPGALVVVEGIDGSGKSTQLYLLKRWLEIGGYRIHFTEWNSSPLVKSATRRGKQRRLLTPTTFSLLHAADFADRCERQILPLLHGGYLVLADRYIYTAFARDAARGCSPHWLRNLYSFAPIPDITFYFRAPLDVAVNRIVAGRPKLKYYEAGMDLGISLDRAESFRIFQERILTNYDQMIGTDDFVLMDGTVRVNKLQKLMRQLVGDRIDLAKFAPKKPKRS